MPSNPFAFGDVYGNAVIFDPIVSAFRAEAYARILIVQKAARSRRP